ncbi:MAG TPA: hypothetical protein VD978_05245 [Azospirillum sp.]|nr:hypothetical protein [Azospirillum sp.]
MNQFTYSEALGTPVTLCGPLHSAKAAQGADLRLALHLPLTAQAVSIAAKGLVENLTATVNAHEAALGTRVNKRGDASMAKLRRAVEALVGDLLLNLDRCPGGWSYRCTDAKAFTGQEVPHRQFKAVYGVAQAMGWIEVVAPYQQFVFDGVAQGYAPRLRPAEALLRIAEDHGINLDAPEEHFARPKTVTVTSPLVLKAPSIRDGHRKVKGKELDYPETDQTKRKRNEIEEMNRFARSMDIQGCVPVAWRRIFNGSFDQGGRWYAVGDDCYQQMPKENRLEITINGEAVAEVDVKASHLTCLYGLLGEPFDRTHDPYRIEGLPRAVVKAWVTATIGNGKPIGRWSLEARKRALEADVDLRQYKVGEVSRCILNHHPVLSQLQERGINSLILAAKEAEAMTKAMLRLKGEGILALPVHDSLIVPRSAIGRAKLVLEEMFMEVVNVSPMLEVIGSQDGV